MIKFDLPKNQSSIIKVIGVGGGGSNAVTHMFRQGIRGVDFIISNTDRQVLEISPVPVKIPLGKDLTQGLGAGSVPEVGKQAALESIEEIREMLQHNTRMLFITAGMGGGTGTGAAPVIASVARELGILTVGIVTIPFVFEGRKRKQQAEQGLQELRKYVDTLLVICNDKLRELHGDLKLSEAFGRADNILTTAARGIAEIITVTGYINVDFNDVNTVMKNSGVAIMGTGVAEGENRAVKAVEMALSSPLLNDNDIVGAQNMLLYIASGEDEVSMDEVTEITDYIQNAAGASAEIIWGNGTDESLGKHISVTIIATGFGGKTEMGGISMPGEKEKEKPVVIGVLTENPVTPVPVPNEEKYPDMTLKTVKPDQIEEIVAAETKVVYDIDGNIQEPKKNEPQIEAKPDISATLKNENPTPVQQTTREAEVQNPVHQPAPQITTTPVTEENPDLMKRSHDRIQRLREMSVKLKTSEGLNQIEKEPAYLRRKVELPEMNPSSESEVSRYTLSDNEEGNKTEFRSNSYLHDNVD